jgi:hypothetical protein
LTDQAASLLSNVSAPLLKMRAMSAEAKPAPAPAPVTTNLDLPTLPSLNTPREDAVFLLHVAAEVEHALMVQYLYASYSLGYTTFAGAPPPNAAVLVDGWREKLKQIAREEMGHFMTVQNLLRLAGAPLNFEREDFPFRGDLYPFHFTLEKFTKNSLAKYVVAEMPHMEDPPPEIHEIIKLATGSAQMPINRVGGIYLALYYLFATEADLAATDPWTTMVREGAAQAGYPRDWHLGDADFADGAAAARYQGRRKDWGGDTDVLIPAVETRRAALESIRLIAVQGEGIPVDEDDKSHFMRFFNIWQELSGVNGWEPTRAVPDNPRQDGGAGGTQIQNERSRKWAELCNLRYSLLLRYLHHFLIMPGPLYLPDGDRTARGHLLLWTFNEMRRLGKIANFLPDLPLTDDADPRRAGAPFTLPPMHNLPELQELERWDSHRHQLRRAAGLIASMRPDPLPSAEQFLADVAASDLHVMTVAGAVIDGTALPVPDRFRKTVHVLEEAVRGFEIDAFHGSFWRDKNVGDFKTQTGMIFGEQVIIPGDGENSPLYQMIKGEEVAQMPRRRPPIAPERQTFIRDWITAKCPDSDPPNEIGIRGEADPRQT